MSYKKRAIAAVLSAALMLTALTGCGSTGSSSAQGGSDGASLDYPKNDVQDPVLAHQQ